MKKHRKKPAPPKLPSTDPAARDEGPRLIPLKERRSAPTPVEVDRRHMDLADIALGKHHRDSRMQ